jgi:ABC-type sugar transport system substrate-binding protein
MRRIQLLLADAHNAYQQLLVESARSAARDHGLGFIEPRFADGSLMRQMGQCYDVLRADPRPDGVLLLLVAGDEMENAVSALAKGGVDCVVLNRIPGYLERLRRQFPERLLAAVAPDQTEIGRIQGRQSLRLLPEGGTVLLILGAHNASSAVSREKGFREVVGTRLDVHVIEGKWQAERADQALSDWLRFGAKRAREVDLIVSHNDAMALGVRRALQRHESERGAEGLATIPIVGCDGLPDEGAKMVGSRELTATVVMPASSPPGSRDPGRLLAAGRSAEPGNAGAHLLAAGGRARAAAPARRHVATRDR